MSETLFISDCHLSVDRPDITQHFIEFIKTRATQARVLYILGDLFELWLGDDDPAEEYTPIFEALKTCSKTCKIFFIAGNRDFLVGNALANNIGFEVLAEPHIISLNHQSTALIHGDSLCTDDIDYQNFKQLVRSNEWQSDFMAKSLMERQALAKQLRTKSHEAMKGKQTEIMDVNQQAVIDFFKEYNVTQIIHGHTHRPAVHLYEDDRLKRFVLGDWQPEPSYISVTNDQIKLIDPRILNSD